MGLPRGTSFEVGERAPVSPTTKKTETQSLSWLATARKRPEGSNAMSRGVAPPLGRCARSDRRPVSPSMPRIAMLVMTTICAVDEAAAGMDRDPRAMVLLRALRDRGDDVDQVEAAAVAVIAQGDDGRVDLADDDGDAATGVESEMPRAAALRQRAAHRACFVEMTVWSKR